MLWSSLCIASEGQLAHRYTTRNKGDVVALIQGNPWGTLWNIAGEGRRSTGIGVFGIHRVRGCSLYVCVGGLCRCSEQAWHNGCPQTRLCM